MYSVKDNVSGGTSRIGYTEELYNSLIYSGLVTPTMTFEEMCDRLAIQYPEFDGVFFDGLSGEAVAKKYQWEFASSSTTYPDGSSVSCGGNGPAYGDYRYRVGCTCGAYGNRSMSGWVRNKDWIYVPAGKYKYLNVQWAARCSGDVSTYNKQSHVRIQLFGENTGTIINSQVWEYVSYQGSSSGSGTAKLSIGSSAGQRMRVGLYCDASGSQNVDGSMYVRSTWMDADKIWLSET